MGKQQFLGPHLAVIVKAHGMPMRPGVLDDENVAINDLRQGSLHRKFVVIFTQRANHIDRLGVSLAIFPQHLDMVVGAVECRPHQSGHAGIDADVGAVNVLAVDGPYH